MGEIVTTAVYTLIFGFVLGLGVVWWRHPGRLKEYMRGTVFEAWETWLVPSLAWGFVVVGALALGYQVAGWLS